jgi:hypothetical protein
MTAVSQDGLDSAGRSRRAAGNDLLREPVTSASYKAGAFTKIGSMLLTLRPNCSPLPVNVP